MFLLSLQTGLIDLKMPNRLGAMTIILFIVAASLLQTILEVPIFFVRALGPSRLCSSLRWMVAADL